MKKSCSLNQIFFYIETKVEMSMFILYLISERSVVQVFAFEMCYLTL